METKKWWKSKGIDGSLSSLVTMVIIFGLGIFGIEAEMERESIALIFAALIGIVSNIIALIGRLKAKTRIE